LQAGLQPLQGFGQGGEIEGLWGVTLGCCLPRHGRCQQIKAGQQQIQQVALFGVGGAASGLGGATGENLAPELRPLFQPATGSR
jgi:hypothetical protein